MSDGFDEFFKKEDPFKIVTLNEIDIGKKKGFLVNCKINNHQHHFFIEKERIEFTDKTFTLDDFHELHTWIRDTYTTLIKK
jgi:hypothetical protein